MKTALLVSDNLIDGPSEPATTRFNWLLYIFFCAGLIFAGGGFVLYTSGADLTLALDATAGSLVSQLILGLFYMVAVLLLVSSRDFLAILRLTWPILVLPMLAIASVAWSSEPELTLRRAIAFAGTVLFGLSLGSAYQFRDCIILISRALAVVMILSILVVLIDPRSGVHQSYDAMQSVHAGSWRGIFAHRNTLGLWGGVTIVVLVIVGRQAFGGLLLWTLAIASAVICLLRSGSSGGIVIMVLPLTYFAALIFSLRQPPRLRSPVLLLALVVSLFFYVAFDEISQIGLAMLGRDSNLTGRTVLWHYILELLQSTDKPLGLGYFVGTLWLDERLSTATLIRNINTHNGYLESLVYFGYLGLIVTVSIVGLYFVKSLIFAFKYKNSTKNLNSMPAILLFLIAIHNLVESTIVSPNNINTLLFAATVGMMARAILPKLSSQN